MSIKKSTILFLVVLFQLSFAFAQKNSKGIVAKSSLVAPLVDAANSRFFYFNSATRPFGMVNLSPDMNLRGTWNTGYRYNDDTIKCFSHIHCWEMSGIPVLPTTGIFKGHLGPDTYGSSYSHDEEVAKAGYHKVVLKDYAITAELSTTNRVGFHRYTYPKSNDSYIIFDFTTVLGSSETQSSKVNKANDHRIEGEVTMAATIRRPKPITVYFVAEFDKPFLTFGGWKKGVVIPTISSLEGEKTGVFVKFNTTQGEKRLMKVAISYVSVEEAQNNMKSELPAWNFDEIVKQSALDWDVMLGRIDVEGGTAVQQQRFYTDLFHALQGRRIVSDVSGTYIDNTGAAPLKKQVKLDANGKPAFNMYNSDSFWGAQWSLNTLWHLVYPEITEEFINCMLQMYDDGGLVPRGPSGGNYTYVMTGAATTPFITSAYLKGIKGFDINKAYQAMKVTMLQDNLDIKSSNNFITTNVFFHEDRGLDDYKKYGYIPCDLLEESVTITLEYAYDDWCVAQVAKALGEIEDYDYFMNRSKSYTNLFDSNSGFMRGKFQDGKTWRKPFDPKHSAHRIKADYTEGNAWQHSWFVPHDVKNLIKLHGGNELFSEKLEQLFVESSEINGENISNDISGLIGQYAHGNEPSHHIAYLFNHANKPWLTQYWVNQILKTQYNTTPDGLSGNEDCGQMSAWYVFSSMGLYSMNPVSGNYEIGSPLFEKTTLSISDEIFFIIEAEHVSEKNIYIQSATLNGSNYNKTFISHKQILKGGTLKFVMGPEPNKNWGV
mgnify:CR=1 FL=1